MDKTKSKLAAFFETEEEPSYPQKTVDDQKLAQYTQGTVRKSRREKEKEAAEAKQREEEQNQARAYADFLHAFEGEEANRRKAGSAFVKAGESTSAYQPLVKERDPPETSRSRSRPMLDDPPSPPSNTASKPKGKRAMDAFLEEIKKEQAMREAKYSRGAHGRSVTALAAYESQSGSKDRGDPETTNLFVANLPSHVTEQALGMFFARHGPVGSVKIMWPRGDAAVGPGGDMTASRRNKSAGLSGFVSFMKRKDAETALRELDGFDWGGSILRVGWSKAVQVAARPLYAVPRAHSRSRSRSPRRRDRSRSRSPSRERRRSHSPSRENRYRSSRRSRSRSRSPKRRRRSRSRSLSRSPRRKDSVSPRRDDEDNDTGVTDGFIRAVAAEVRGQGNNFEKRLREWERDNNKYAFLTRRKHRRHVFYRGLVERTDLTGSEFVDEGYNSAYSTDSAEESEQERTRKTTLGKLARKRFESMLRGLSGKRGELARCMAFCLDHAEASKEISDVIITSLLVDSTPVPRKVARLYLICDILHNSAAPVPSAWKFRQEFQSRLGIVFDHFAAIYHSFPGRITANTFKKQITSIIDIWEDWIVFPPEFTAELRARLDGVSHAEYQPKAEEAQPTAAETEANFASRFKSKSFQPAAEAEGPALTIDNYVGSGNAADVDGEPIDDVDGVPIDNVDGEPIDDDVDGIPTNDIDGEPMDDVDGEPLNDIDGEPMDDDMDGAPIDI